MLCNRGLCDIELGGHLLVAANSRRINVTDTNLWIDLYAG